MSHAGIPQQARLAEGGLIDRSKVINFHFNGKRYQGYKGDTLASALLANGIHLVGRGMKFHRPRGILAAGVEESNALIKLGSGGREEPSVRATCQPLYEGLVANSQNCWPSVNWDIGAILDWTSGLWPAGFYNKTFIWPSWHLFEGFVRRAAGLGTLPTESDPDHYSHHNTHCDILVVGGGEAGLEAALNASDDPACQVLLVEQGTTLGGSLLAATGKKASERQSVLQQKVQQIEQQLRSRDNVTVLTSTTASACLDHNYVLAAEKCCPHHQAHTGPRERLWKIRAGHIVLASGAIEQPLVFPNNDRPGIMLAGAVREYLNRYGVTTGHRVAVVTNNNSAYQTAFDLKAAGAQVPVIVDTRPAHQIGAALEKAKAQGISVYCEAQILNTHGRRRVTGITLADRSGKPIRHGNSRRIACDSIAMAGGWQPAVHLFSQAGGKLRYDPSQAAFIPDRYPENFTVIGAAAGNDDNYGIQRSIVTTAPAKQWIDFQHDVTLRDIDIAVQEDYTSVEHLKRYTTTGMSVDQGKTSNINALTALAERTGRPVGEVGTTTFRPFYMPVTLGTLAGRRQGERYATTRQTPMHDLLQQAGAEFWDYGHWQRPAAYPQTGETLHQAMQREALAVRKSVGMYDGSPLGKIEVTGPDAAEFLNRFYINNVHSLKPGKARYGIMLNEQGIVMDDGIVVCLADQHYLVHTTSGNADHIVAWMEEWQQCEWPDLNVVICPVTTQWANVTLSGPNSRKVLQQLNSTIDLANDAFPHMSFREGVFQNPEGTDIPVRIMRASFTGEMGYEINVPASYGAALWQNLRQAGKQYNITPYGVESLMILRSEKGYLHVGADTDGKTVPDDIGWGGPIAKKQADFIGKRSLLLPENTKADRYQYVGIETADATQTVVTGTHIVDSTTTAAPAESQGFITSAFFSPSLDRWVALGLVQSGRSRIGETIKLFHQGKLQLATVVEPVFFNKEGGRLHV